MKTADITERKYLRPQEVRQVYGIKPGVLYSLLSSGKVRGCKLSDDPTKKATRLISKASLDGFLARLEAAQSPCGSAEHAPA